MSERVESIYKAGSQPPKGYREWHEWADVQIASGLRQRKCILCSKWYFPQEAAKHESRDAHKPMKGKQ